MCDNFREKGILRLRDYMKILPIHIATALLLATFTLPTFATQSVKDALVGSWKCQYKENLAGEDGEEGVLTQKQAFQFTEDGFYSLNDLTKAVGDDRKYKLHTTEVGSYEFYDDKDEVYYLPQDLTVVALEIDKDLRKLVELSIKFRKEDPRSFKITSISEATMTYKELGGNTFECDQVELK